MHRRSFLTIVPAASVTGTFPAAREAVPQSSWDLWKEAFLTPEGRVVDALQDMASHSEGQGWAMLLAAQLGDGESFARMFEWTERYLAVRRDPLLSWRWRPGDGIADYNNASDGDLFYAWALLVAARRFETGTYADRSAEVARAIDEILVKPAPGGGLLLRPGAERFSDNGREILNLSYIMPLALHALGAAFDLPRLGEVANDGEALIARVAETGLTPDWIALDEEGWRAATGYGTDYSYDAMRVALYLVWSGRFANPAVARLRAFLEDTGSGTPVRVDPSTGQVLETSDAAGYAALSTLIRNTGRSVPLVPLPDYTAEQSYYPATLHLLSLVASRATLA